MVIRLLSGFSIFIVHAADLSHLSPDSVLNKTTALIFRLMIWGGVVLTAAGVILIVRSLTSGTDSAESDPGRISKGISLVIGGIAMIAVRTLIGVLIGREPDRIIYFA